MRKLMLAVLLTVTCSSWAGIGAVADHKGNGCEIHRNKTKVPGHKGSEVESMDTYVTGACAASITFKDDTKVKVNENSRLLIDDFVFDPKKSDAGKLALKVGAGTVRYASGQIAKNNPQQVNIKTPTAAIAVRGTDFTMTVDETGESLVVLVPSCKHESEKKQYELDEQRCKVGKIDVSTQVGTVTLDRAFEATYVASATQAPTPPVVVNLTEGKINNNLIIVKPSEVQQAVKESKKSKKDLEQEELEAEATQQMMNKLAQTPPPPSATKTNFTYADGKKNCDPGKSICVRWERPDGVPPSAMGKGVAFKETPNEHYAEIKTQGFVSNTSVTIIQNDVLVTELLGDGGLGGNSVLIKQNNGVLKK